MRSVRTAMLGMGLLATLASGCTTSDDTTQQISIESRTKPSAVVNRMISGEVGYRNDHKKTETDPSVHYSFHRKFEDGGRLISTFLDRNDNGIADSEDRLEISYVPSWKDGSVQIPFGFFSSDSGADGITKGTPDTFRIYSAENTWHHVATYLRDEQSVPKDGSIVLRNSAEQLYSSLLEFTMAAMDEGEN